MTSYDEVAYPSLPLPQTQPDRLVTQAVLLGCRAPDPRQSRVLEIGCSDAGNLAWLAARAPESRFLGVDLSEAAVARAQDVVDGLPNIDVRVGDLTQLDAGTFDIIIAHGVLSWLPDPTALLACVDRHLADDGIAYVSYNALPGSLVRQLAGDPIRRFTGGRSGDQVSEARALMRWVTESKVESTHAEIIRSAMRLSMEKPDHVLVHDEMSRFNRAYYFDDFVSAAAQHGLAYLGECHLADSEPPVGAEIPHDLAAWMGSDEIARQQAFDYVRNRAFRQTLLVRPDNAPASYRVNPQRLGGLWAASPVQQVAEQAGKVKFRLLQGVEVTTDSQDLIADLTAIGTAWPGSVAVDSLRGERASLLKIHASRGLELRFHACPAKNAGDRPLVDEYVRARAAADGRLASLRHDPISLDDRLSRTAVGLMDGRSSRRSIAAQLADMPGVPVDLPTELDKLIKGLGQAGLLLG